MMGLPMMHPSAADLPQRTLRRVGWLGLLALVVLCIVLVVPTLPRVTYQKRVDEGFYLHYMQRVGAGGLSVFPSLFQAYLDHQNLWILPNPLRVAFLCVAGLWAFLFGPSFMGLTLLSLLSMLLLLPVSYAFFSRHRDPAQALWTTALIAASPLMLALSRRALNDSFATLWMTLAMWLFYEAVHSRRQTRVRVAFAISFAVAILAKEPAVLLGVPFAAFAVLESLRRRDGLRALAGDALLLVLPPLGAVVIMIVLAGGVSPFLAVVRIILTSPASNEYAKLYGGGPWYRYLIDWCAVSPWTLLLAVAGLGALLTRLREGTADPLERYAAILTVLLLFALCLFTKNLRYAMALESPLRFFAVGALCGWLPGAQRPRLLVGTALLALLCYGEWRSFDRLFVEGAIYDPISSQLLGGIGVIPPN